jgi:hypothetical protein
MMDIGHLNMKKTVCSFETWGTTYPTMLYQFPECCSPQGICTLQKCFSVVVYYESQKEAQWKLHFHKTVRAW